MAAPADMPAGDLSKLRAPSHPAGPQGFEVAVPDWTIERRARQSAAIRQWRPWERSTGPRTSEGKGRVARNAWRGGRRAEFRQLICQVREMLSEQADRLSDY